MLPNRFTGPFRFERTPSCLYGSPSRNPETGGGSPLVLLFDSVSHSTSPTLLPCGRLPGGILARGAATPVSRTEQSMYSFAELPVSKLVVHPGNAPGISPFQAESGHLLLSCTMVGMVGFAPTTSPFRTECAN